MSQDELSYRRTVAELQELAKGAPYVTQDWVLTVASMAPEEMRRRLIRSYDWHGQYHHSLDGIPEIQHLPGSGIDGCRTHKEVRAVVTNLVGRVAALESDLSAANEGLRLAALAEEGAKEAFGHVVDDKRALEKEVKRVTDLLHSAHESIRRLTANSPLKAST